MTMQPNVAPMAPCLATEKMREVYVDGSCSNNGSPNARAALGIWSPGDEIVEHSEVLEGHKLTNQVAELSAILRALQIFYGENELFVYSDSEYSVRTLTEWAYEWRKNGWRRSGGKDVANVVLVREIIEMLDTMKEEGKVVTIIHVRGHSDNVGNVNADRLAQFACTSL